MVLYDLLPDPKTQGGYWTYRSGPALAPPPPSTYNGEIDFSNAPYGTYVYTYQVQRLGCFVSSDVTIEHVEKLFRTNIDCTNAQNILTHFYNTSDTIVSGTSVFSDEPLFTDSCTQPNTVPPTENPWGGDVTGEVWYSTLWPQSLVNVTPVVVRIEYGGAVDALSNPLLAVYSSTGDCDSLTLLGTNQGIGFTASVVAFVPPSVTNFLLIRVGTRGTNQGMFNLIIET